MSRFDSVLDLRSADTHNHDGAWIVDSPLIYYSDHLGAVVRVPAGFCTDLASVPRLPIVYTLVGGRADAAAVLHDFLYSDGKVSRKDADQVLYEAAVVTGVSKWQAWLMWLGVRAGGSAHYNRNPQ